MKYCPGLRLLTLLGVGLLAEVGCCCCWCWWWESLQDEVKILQELVLETMTQCRPRGVAAAASIDGGGEACKTVDATKGGK